MWSVFINRHSPEQPFRFQDLIALQARVLAELRPGGDSALLFAELPPTLTLGARQAGESGVSGRMQGRAGPGVEVVTGERGGNETWHGPGQWVGFVLTPLREFTGDPKGVRRAVHRMLELLLPVVQHYVPDARIEDGSRLGIWSPAGKLASIGIKIRDGYTSSGFALNCIPRPEAFAGIDPCGIAGAVPDFLFSRGIAPEGRESEFEKIPDRIFAVFKKSAAPVF
jgi:lipoyl(octanoyl) transferase